MSQEQVHRQPLPLRQDGRDQKDERWRGRGETLSAETVQLLWKSLARPQTVQHRATDDPAIALAGIQTPKQ